MNELEEEEEGFGKVLQFDDELDESERVVGRASVSKATNSAYAALMADVISSGLKLVCIVDGLILKKTEID